MADQSGLVKGLREALYGEVLDDEQTLERHSTDQSMYQIRPLAVAFPRDEADVVAAVNLARDAGIPITPRGMGSGTAGAALGRGLLVAWRKGGVMNDILGFQQVDGEPRATVQPGLVHNDLQDYLRARGLYLPADPSSGSFCLLGGNVATKASGPHALKHGSIDRYLGHLRVVTAAGEVVDTAREESIPARIRDGVMALRDELRADAETVALLRSRQERKLASGYNLFALIRDMGIGELVAQLLVGSVGTLGVVTAATLRAEPYVEGHATTLLFFRSLEEAGEAVQHLIPIGVAAIEVMNHRTIEIVKERRTDLDAPDGEAHMLLVEYEGPERWDQIARAERMLAEKGYQLVQPPVTVEDEAEQAQLWKLRKALLPTVRGYRKDRKALSIVNDVGVEVRHLAAFIRDVEAIFARHGLMAAIYGHAGSGNLHLRPLFDPTNPGLKPLLRTVADEVYGAALGYGGTITAEHGMGRLRAPYLEREWGARIVGYMRRVKAIFDPDDVLNPGVMFSDADVTDDMKPL
jgi:glycolate oxidase